MKSLQLLWSLALARVFVFNDQWKAAFPKTSFPLPNATPVIHLPSFSFQHHCWEKKLTWEWVHLGQSPHPVERIEAFVFLNSCSSYVVLSPTQTDDADFFIFPDAFGFDSETDSWRGPNSEKREWLPETCTHGMSLGQFEPNWSRIHPNISKHSADKINNNWLSKEAEFPRSRMNVTASFMN
jgi:hypothetical protein